MTRTVALALIAALLLAGCGGAEAPEIAALRGCDDGGSGGVIIDGTCL